LPGATTFAKKLPDPEDDNLSKPIKLRRWKHAMGPGSLQTYQSPKTGYSALIRPPSTLSMDPVMYEACLLAKKAMTAPNSSARP
jgi:hypothetical protein